MINLTTAAGICRLYSVDFEVKCKVGRTEFWVQRLGNQGDGVGACHALGKAGARLTHMAGTGRTSWAFFELESLT